MGDYEIVVIGAGPAGVAAALYAKRAGAKTVIIDDGLVGGAVNYTDYVENYPGLSKPVSGMEFGNILNEQMERFGAERFNERVEKLFLKDGLPFIKTSISEIVGKVAIIATGCRPKKLNVEGEERFIGRGVSFCAVCDGPLFKDKEVAVIGGGDSACEEAIHLARFAKRVHLIHRRNKLRAFKILIERVSSNPRITLHLERVVSRYEGDIRLRRLVLRSTIDGSEETLEVEGAFLYVGNEPNTGFIECEIKKDENGFIITDDNMLTSVERVYAAGDVRAKPLRQIVTAVSDGAVAASDAVKRYLEN